MAKNLNLTLNGTDNLSSALDEVAQAAAKAERALREAEDAISGIATDMKSAATSAGRLEEKLEDLGQVGILASESTSKVERSTQDLTIKAQGLSIVLDDAAESELKFAGAGAVASDATDQLEEQTQEATGAIGRMKAALGLQSSAALSSVGPNLLAAGAIDEMGDEAAQARNKMAGAASMSELLSLQSSALSINVGAFTIALRNLTTQVPLLVTTLGNLSSAIVGVGSALGAAGFGGLAVAFGGAVGHVNEIAGEMATMEERMQAVQAIGREFMSMLEEAIEPLVNLSDSTNVFIRLLEGLATTVRAFSQSIADSYADGPLRDAIQTLSAAWMDSIVAIGDAFEIMLERLGEAGIFDFFADGIRAFDEFLIFVTNVTEEMMQVLGRMNEDGSLSRFITNIMDVGREIAGGLTPILSEFFVIVSVVAEEISALGSETIGTVVQILALGLAANRAASILANIAQPLAIATGHLFDITDGARSATSAFMRMSGRIISGVGAISTGFNRLALAASTAMPFLDPEENNLKQFSDRLDKSNTPLSRLTGSISNFSTVLDTKLSVALSGARARLANFVTTMRTTGEIGPITLDDFRNSLSSVAGITDVASESFSQLVGAQVIAGDSSRDLARNIISLGKTADLSGKEMRELRAEMRRMMADGELAELQVDDLSDELQELGFSAKVAEEAVNDTNGELTEMSAKAGIVSGVSGAFSTMTIALGGLAAILAGVVLVVGAAAAGLMLLGETGEDAESIISGLKETLEGLADQAMPFIVASGNMVIDLFNSLLFVAEALAKGMQDIAVSMGLIDPSDVEDQSLVESFGNVLDSIIPVINTVGQLARILAGALAPVILTITGIIADFVEALQIAEIINSVSATVEVLSIDLGLLAQIISITANVLSSLISGLVKIGVITGVAIAAIGALTLAWLALNGQIALTVAGLFTLTSPISATAAVIGVLIGAVVILLEELGVLDWMIDKIMAGIGLLGKGFAALANVVEVVFTGIVNTIADAWNENIATDITFTIPDFVPKYGGEHTIKIPPMGQMGGGGGSSGGSGPSASDRVGSDLFSGLDTMGGLGTSAKEAAMGGTAQGVQYNEGDTMNTYNQEIDADPEDKAQLSRLTKDAIEEANSFARMQLGGQ